MKLFGLLIGISVSLLSFSLCSSKRSLLAKHRSEDLRVKDPIQPDPELRFRSGHGTLGKSNIRTQSDSAKPAAPSL